jgi:hypothetical protein
MRKGVKYIDKCIEYLSYILHICDDIYKMLINANVKVAISSFTKKHNKIYKTFLRI